MLNTIFIKRTINILINNEQILKKSNNTNIKKYGFSRSSKNEKVKNKISKKLKDHWNNKLLSEHDILSISGNSYELMCECNPKIIKNK